MDDYAPDIAPSPEEWLALPEEERLRLVERYHAAAGIEIPKARLHTAIHTIIETQLADPVPDVVDAMARLRSEGLDRHEALHAIGSVLLQHLVQLHNGELAGSGDPNAEYYAALRTLSAKAWLAS